MLLFPFSNWRRSCSCQEKSWLSESENTNWLPRLVSTTSVSNQNLYLWPSMKDSNILSIIHLSVHFIVRILGYIQTSIIEWRFNCFWRCITSYKIKAASSRSIWAANRPICWSSRRCKYFWFLLKIWSYTKKYY